MRNPLRNLDFNTLKTGVFVTRDCQSRQHFRFTVARFPTPAAPVCDYDVAMRHAIRFLWNATKGHHLAPWRSPYLLWRIETYTGVKMKEIGFLEFWEFLWRERSQLWQFLKWTGEMDRYVHPKPRSS